MWEWGRQGGTSGDTLRISFQKWVKITSFDSLQMKARQEKSLFVDRSGEICILSYAQNNQLRKHREHLQIVGNVISTSAEQRSKHSIKNFRRPEKLLCNNSTFPLKPSINVRSHLLISKQQVQVLKPFYHHYKHFGCQSTSVYSTNIEAPVYKALYFYLNKLEKKITARNVNVQKLKILFCFVHEGNLSKQVIYSVSTRNLSNK